MTAPARIRRAVTGDGSALTELMVTARLAAVPAIPPSVHDADDVREWMTSVVLPECEVWLVEEPPGPPLGILVLKDDWVEQLFVAPSHTGEGLGSGLLNQAKARRPSGLQLWTFQSNVRAHRFYERHGFVAVERTDGSGNEERSPDVRYRWRGALSAEPGPCGPQDTQTRQDPT